MASLNKVFLIGNLTRDPDLRYTPSGVAVANFGLAVNRNYKDQNGEWQKETCFVDIVTWGALAERCNDHLSKGKPIFLEGRLQFRTWETDDGQKRNKLDVVADRIQYLFGPKAEDEASTPEDEGTDNDIPF